MAKVILGKVKGDPFFFEDFTVEQLEMLKGPQGEAGPPGRDGEPGPVMPISDSVTSPDSGVAASSKAAKTAYDKAVEAALSADRVPLPESGDAGKVLTVLPDDSLAWQGPPSWGIVGDIQLKPFRPEDLAAYCPGWHFCNGDRYALTSPVGAALNALPATFKTDWGVAVSEDTINIPNMFYPDGRGFFLRAVNGTTRLVGNIEIDQMRPITGQTSAPSYVNANVYGAFYGGSSVYIPSSSTRTNPSWFVYMNSSLLGPNFSGADTHPINIGMTPAIFLGV